MDAALEHDMQVFFQSSSLIGRDKCGLSRPRDGAAHPTGGSQRAV